MKRNIAFFISSNKTNNRALCKAEKYFKKLVLNNRYDYKKYKTSKFIIGIIFEETLEIDFYDDSLSFPVGNLGDCTLKNDRFLKVKVNKDCVEIENDYAGSIPVYFSMRDYLSISNIENFVVDDSATDDKDLSPENIYGFMRYMHFIWDETAYKHIYTMLPDSLYKFDYKNLKFEKKYLKTVKASDDFSNISDLEVANRLNKLNDELVFNSLENYEQIILPLSSGYDSRMILAALSKRDDLKEKLHCFTYGSEGSIEVEAARRLTKKLNIKWNFIDLPLRFLTKKYLFRIHDIFGSSLHMHGMYQLEFFNKIQKVIDIKNHSCLTSGFMTGVPAGQHNSFLGIKNGKNLSKRMDKFSQSQNWNDEELNCLNFFRDKNYIDRVDERFQMAFDRFDGSVNKKAVMFDVWTRQRNFISYYPRTLEWKIPVVSPHMNIRYANFFMSLSEKHLNDRLAVELMFNDYYPRISSIVSNSNGIKSINSQFENFMFFISRVLTKLKLNFFLPKKYSNKSFDFDIPAVRYSKKESIFPLLEFSKHYNDFIKNNFLSNDSIKEIYKKSYEGCIKSYQKLVVIQSLSLSLMRIKKSL